MVARNKLKIKNDNVIINNAEVKKYTLEEWKAKLQLEGEFEYKEGVEIQDNKVLQQNREKNVEKGNPKIWIAPVAALEGNNWGVFLQEEEEKVKTGDFLGSYAGERILPEAAKEMLNNLYLFDVDKFVTIDGEKKRNWVGYLNHGSIGAANVNMLLGKDHSGDSQAFCYVAKKVVGGNQLLLNYGEEYFSNLDYAPIYLHSTDNWKTPSDNYSHLKNHYHDEVIELDSDIVQALGYNKEKYFIVPKSFAILYQLHQGQLSKEKAIEEIKKFSQKELDTPSYVVELTEDSKWKFYGYGKQQHITPLMLACFLGQKDAVKSLLDKNIDITWRSLHGGHDALFFTIASGIDQESKKEILRILVDKIEEIFRKNIKQFQTKVKLKEGPSEINGILLKNVGNLFYTSDSSGKNLFDHMIDRGEYLLYKKYYEEKISPEWQKKVAEKFISERGIFNIILNLDSEAHIKVVDLLLKNISEDFIKKYFEHPLEKEKGNINNKRASLKFSGDKEEQLSKLRKLKNLSDSVKNELIRVLENLSQKKWLVHLRNS